jgi:predicted nucleotidyltransferase component of viral defense system
MYQEKRARQSELLQLLLLDKLYAQSGSERIIFQGGTALRWVYGAMRFSEDLDFVTDLTRKGIEKVLAKVFPQVVKSCFAQFGKGSAEQQIKEARKSAYKILFVFRPERQRERIAVRLEFEMLQEGRAPAHDRFVLMNLPQVAGLMVGGQLLLPYTSSILLAETVEEILSDKLRALFERKYLKGRDLFDIWWLITQRRITIRWPILHEKLAMYQEHFTPARRGDYFQTDEVAAEMIRALESDLTRFVPQQIVSEYRKNEFRAIIDAVEGITGEMWDQGLREYYESGGR